ncbi:MAG: GNAT family N-acetyltransferase [Spirochaetales bacterium]|nr:GNAT family N-acetyltransferase [Spirochaetales bacterium]
MGTSIQLGLPSHISSKQAVDLYFQAFGKKERHLTLFSNDEQTMKNYLEHSMNWNAVLFATHENKLLGMCGIQKGMNPGPFSTQIAPLIAHFQIWGGWWRWILRWLQRTIDSWKEDVLHIEFLVVNPDVRNQGWGSKLLDCAEDEARKQGCKALGLEVIDTNPRAKSLYQRKGFQTIQHYSTQWLTRRAGFSSLEKMQKPLQPQRKRYSR